MRLANATGSRLLYDLNLQLRDGVQWSPLNTVKLLQFAVDEGLTGLIDFELGNGKQCILVSCYFSGETVRLCQHFGLNTCFKNILWSETEIYLWWVMDTYL